MKLQSLAPVMVCRRQNGTQLRRELVQGAAALAGAG